MAGVACLAVPQLMPHVAHNAEDRQLMVLERSCRSQGNHVRQLRAATQQSPSFGELMGCVTAEDGDRVAQRLAKDVLDEPSGHAVNIHA